MEQTLISDAIGGKLNRFAVPEKGSMRVTIPPIFLKDNNLEDGDCLETYRANLPNMGDVIIVKPLKKTEVQKAS